MADYKIKRIYAREVLDSRGNPTIEVDVYTKDSFGREMVPSGASKGKHEAIELRDGGKRYGGKGVRKAVDNINNIISKKLIGMDVRKQAEIDQAMIKLDATPNKARLGANAIMGVSLAVARTGAISTNEKMHDYLQSLSKSRSMCIPIPFMNIINGGRHAGNSLEFQEFMIVPREKNFSESLRIAAETYHALKEKLEKKYGKTAINIGDEGGFAPNLKSTSEALNLIVDSIEELKYGKQIKIAMDVAASEFCSGGICYNFDGKKLYQEKMIGYYEKITKQYPIISIEDPFEEDDFASFASLNKKIGASIQVVGDDLLVTNIERIQKAIEMKSCNCLLLKINQIGTLTEAIEAVKLARKNNWRVMVSHRSGETESSFIADFAVGLGCGQIKAGAPARSERLSKYNQLLRIEETLKGREYGVCDFW